MIRATNNARRTRGEFMAPSSASARASRTRALDFLVISGNTAGLRDLRIAVARLLLAACVAIVGLLPLAAHAAIPVSTGVYFNTSFGRSDSFPKSADACADLAVKIGVATELRLAYYCYYDARRWGGYGFELAERLVSSAYCPANSTAVGATCVCKVNYQEDPTRTSCVLDAPEVAGTSGMCRILVSGAQLPNPILPATAEKFRSEVDLVEAGPAPLSFGRTYRSAWGADASRNVAPMGKAWTHSHAASLKAATGAAVVSSAEGYLRTFTQTSASSPWSATNSADQLVTEADGTWTYRRADDDSTLRFDSAGRLISTTARNGWATTYAYNASGQLASVSNAFNRKLTLAYNGAGQLISVATQDARTVGYAYDGTGRLSSVTYPNGKTRVFLYENTAFPQLLTGILDEAGARWGTFGYDAQGRAISSELAGSVDRYQVSYPSSGSALVIDPLGTSRSFSYSTTKGRLAVTGGSLPSGIGESDAASRVQDGNGLITSETDFKGVKTDTTWDVARRLQTTITRAVGTLEAQTVTTQWHATFSLPVLVTEAGRTTAYAYDDKGNALSQAITDTASSPSTTRTWNWTWNTQGLAATETAPNGAVTTFEYDTRGNLVKSTNALGHETLYSYDTANRVISTTAPNGVVTTYTWDTRDRLLTKSVGSQGTTTLTYKPTGLLETLTLPTGLVLTYSYDSAHRLTGWSNTRGESGTYTLDAMGNRTAELIKDSTGAVAWTAARTINNLNRLSARTDGPNQTHTFGYDANGELVTETNGLNQSTQYGLDPLRRTKAITNAANATATLAYNALDAVTRASDFKGVTTSYARDAQGNATAESSADIGSTTTQYDALGLPSSVTDAIGQATQIQRDVLGRPTLITFADGKTTTLGYDATASAKGYLTSITDRSGTTTYSRDTFGRVIVKTQALASGLTQQVAYSYTAAGQLAGITYPNGNVLLHGYDATGRLVQLSWNGAPLVTGIAWNPMGQPTAWNWAFVPGLAASRSYDTAGRMTATEFASYVYDAAGRITSLTQNLFQPGDGDPMHSSIASANTSWSVSYDAVGRITGFNAAGSQTSFGYDANGNRNASTKTLNGQTTSRSYTVNAGSNRLDGFGQTMGGTSTNVTYAYNANGDLTSDGLRTYSYDAEGRLSAVTTGATDTSPTTRYAHNALGQRVFKTEPLYPPSEGDENDPRFFQGLLNFFTKLWGPATSDAEKLGYAFMYDEDGTLLAETGMGGANSAGSTQYIYLPTAGGPTPVAAVINGQLYAVHSDYLNTPRRLTDSNGQAVWQWAYSAFGDEKPTIAKYRFANLDVTPNPGVTSFAEFLFNLRWPGQYYDPESGLHYNGFRSLDPRTGRYTQFDPIGLRGGPNGFTYVSGNPLKYTDSDGLVAQAIGPALPVLAVGCALTQGCRQAVSDALQSCGRGVGRIKDWLFSDGASDAAPPVPGDLVGDQSSDRAGLTKNGKRHTSGPMTPENGGTGDASRDFDKLTGGSSQPAGGTYPPGALVGPNGVVLRPGQKGSGPRIDIPGNGSKPPETLHY
jgi:RHS repeat-associated protein